MDPIPEQPSDASPPPPRKRSVLPIVVLLALVALGVGGYFAWRAYNQPRGTPEAPVADAGTAPDAADAGPAVNVDDGDALFKKLAPPWSAQPAYKEWVDALGVRSIVAATQRVAEGESPRPALPFLTVKGAFSVREEDAAKPGKAPPPRKGKRKAGPPPKYFIAKASYQRYDPLTKVFSSIDAAAAGDAYGQLRPYLQAAFAEIGKPDQQFDDVLKAAIDRLAGVALLEGEVELVPMPKGTAYAFKDATLEALSPAEKHLLRMGPENGKAVQTALKTFAQHAGLAGGK